MAHAKRLPRILTRLLTYGVVACIICSTMGALGRWHWVLDLFSHFRIQYIITLFSTSAVLLRFKQPRWAIAGSVTGIALSISLVPYVIGKKTSTPSLPEYHLLSYNLNTANQNYEAIRDFILTTDADFVFLMEVNQTWITQLASLKSHYPYDVQHPRYDNFGVVLYSKYPITNEEIVTFGTTSIPTIDATIQLAEYQLNIIGTHPFPPVNKVNSDRRNNQLNAIAEHIQHTTSDYQIVAGDLNCTPWSYIFKEFIQQTSLHDSNNGNGIHSTWFSHLPWFSVPIDHVLASPNIVFTNKEIKGTFGSDHNAVLVTFELHPDET